MIIDILLPLFAVGLAELGDKTQLAVLTLAAKHKEHWHIFWGAMLGFLLVDGIAILFGGIISAYIPLLYLKMLAGILFILFGILTLRSEDGNPLPLRNNGTFTSAFALIFVAELGDKTQIASAVFATQYHPLFVFVGVMLALALLTGSAIIVGKKLKEKVNPKHISIASGIVFILIGIITLYPVVRGFF